MKLKKGQFDTAGNAGEWADSGVLITASVVKYYAFGGQTVMEKRGDAVIYLSTDQISSTSLTTDANGAEISQVRYDPYGSVRWSSGTIPTDKTFTGQRSEGFELMDYKARYYAPQISQFIQLDSIIPDPYNPPDWNRYSYVQNNPINFTDPSGNITCEDSFDYCNPRDTRVKLDWFDFNIITGRWSIPKAINSTKDIYMDEIELISRAILGEEPGKLFSPFEDDAIGVAWAIRNRHDSGYYASKIGPSGENWDWYWSANSEIYGNRTSRATDPIGSGYWKSWKDSVTAYNRARSIAGGVLSSPSSADITGGNGNWGRWADAVAPNGQEPIIVSTVYGKTCTNCIPVERTRFTYGVFVQVKPFPSEGDYWRYFPATCVNTASICN